MEELNSASTPVFKKIDHAIFDQIDKFKLTPSYQGIQDFYNGIEEDQQKAFKGAILLSIFLIPALILAFLWWGNASLKEDLDTRVALVAKANEIIGQGQGLQSVSPAILATNPIDSESMMTSRLSNLLSGMGVDLSKIKVSNFQGNMISSNVMKAEADFAFSNLSTDELMNIFTTLIQREKFRIESVDIKRNSELNLLQGQFHAIHFSAVQANEGEE